MHEKSTPIYCNEYSETSPYGHLTITATLAQSQIVFHSAN